MAQTTLDLSDAAELAQMLTFLAGWLSGSQQTPSPKAWPFTSATPPTTLTTSAPTCTGSPSCSAKPTAKNSSASRPHNRQDRRGAPA
jgi:hypothetical protein